MVGEQTPLTGSKYNQLLVEFEEGERENLYSGFFSNKTTPPATQAAEVTTTSTGERKERKERAKKTHKKEKKASNRNKTTAV